MNKSTIPSSSSFADLAISLISKEKLTAEKMFVGLLDHGLFAEKIPPCFTTKGLSQAVAEVKAELLLETDDENLFNDLPKFTHDYIRYESLRDINIPRHLGIPHPESYAAQAIVLKKHWSKILEHFNKPEPAVSRIYVRKLERAGGRIFEMNYKGGERYKLEEREIQWKGDARFLVEADIAQCFPSIYTHAIPWALHGKSNAKPEKGKKKSDLFGNVLDSATQCTRDRQTNGLLIGPHASNIISEIILTQVDQQLQKKGYSKLVRYIDDYSFFATSFEEAEAFIRDLGLSLRFYEMSLNEKKTQILALPCPSEEEWKRALNAFSFPAKGQEITFFTVRALLDLALQWSQKLEKTSPINYAIKKLAKEQSEADKTSSTPPPRLLNDRAKKLYTQEAMNLAIAYPYLVPLLDEHVFLPYRHKELEMQIHAFVAHLLQLGTQKLYPDTIAHALHLALKYQVPLSEEELKGVVELDNCLVDVLLWEYANWHCLTNIKKKIKTKATELQKADKREQDKNWLLIYQLWSAEMLGKKNQVFLKQLKEKGFSFLGIQVFQEGSSNSESSDEITNSNQSAPILPPTP